MPKTDLTADEVRAILRYDPATGLFTWIRTARRGWIGKIAGSRNAMGYVEIGIRGKLYYGHRIAWLYMTGEWPTQEIDHKIGKSNAWENLRSATSALNKENQRQARKDNKSTGILGVYPYRRKFKASISAAGKQYHLGVFERVEDAQGAYLKAKRAMHQGCTI